MKAEIFETGGRAYFVTPGEHGWFHSSNDIETMLMIHGTGNKSGTFKIRDLDYTFNYIEEDAPEYFLDPIPAVNEIVEDKPRAWTPEEVANMIVEGAVNTAHYWSTSPGCGTMEERVSGCAFSILSMLDGSTMNLPGMDLMPTPHPDDKQYDIDNGENYFEAGTVVSTSLHDMYHSKQREMFERYERVHPHHRMEPKEQREMFLRAVVTIANTEAVRPNTPVLEACHNTAKGVLDVLDGQYSEDLPPFMLFASPTKELNARLAAEGRQTWDSSIPLNRQEPTYGVTEGVGEKYDSVRRRTRNAGEALFGK